MSESRDLFEGKGTAANTDAADSAGVPKKERRKKSCLFFGCAGCGVISLLAVIILLLVSFFTMRGLLNHFIGYYCEAQPLQLSAITVSEERAQEVVRRIDDFQKAIDQASSTEPLVLTSDEINTYIQNSADTAMLKDRLFVQLIQDKVRVEWSFPLTILERITSHAKGAYFNGNASFSLGMKDGVLSVDFDSFELGQEALSQKDLANINAKAKNRVYWKEIEKTLETIEVKDGKVTLTPKQNTSGRVSKPA